MTFNGVEKTLYYKAVQLLAQRSHSTVELKQKLVIYASKKYDNLDSLSKHIEAVINHCFLLYRGFSHGDICDVFTLFR